MNGRSGMAATAWLVAVVFYFYQYVLRSAPAVMMPQLSEAYGLSVVDVASLVGLFYYGYAACSLIAGTAVDEFGARAVLPIGALLVAAGTLMFGSGNLAAANVGRLLQGAGGAFALVGAVYIASEYFPASRAATLTGAAQMFGMAGGSAGQVVVGPMIAGGLLWSSFWYGMGVIGLLAAIGLLLLLPRQTGEKRRTDWYAAALSALATVFKNPQTILCGLIAGLLFIPTTVFDMIWGVRFLQDALGFEYGEAVLRSSTVPVGWIIGCPLMGMLSDRLGRRKPVLIGAACILLLCMTWVLYGPHNVLPPYIVGFVAGVASGGAMLAYTVSKEANPPHLSGSATGVVSFLNLAFSALVQPVFGWIMRKAAATQSTPLENYQTTFEPLLYGIALAILLTFVLKETGSASRTPVATREAA